MDEREALTLIAKELSAAGDDAAVVGDRVLTTDLLRKSGDFPDGVTQYTAGWRAVGASLSDVAAMGATAEAAVAAYAAPTLVEEDLQAFIRGAKDVCATVGAEYVGGDLDTGGEFTVAATALGTTTNPVYRTGASTGEIVCVTGTLGRTAAALRLFEQGALERANQVFRFQPRVNTGRILARAATAMTDASDGLARSLYQLGEASDCGFAIESTKVPVDDLVGELARNREERRELGYYTGEDFELVCTLPGHEFRTLREESPTQVTRIGAVTGTGIQLDGEPLPDKGYEH